MFIAQGKTNSVEESQIGDVGYHWKSHSESGWVTEDVFCQYLHHIRQYYDDGDKIYLIHDVYTVHRKIEVINEAAALNIEMIFIPAGLTDAYQPLDRRIFGVLKAKARRYFRMRYSESIDIETTKIAAAQDFVAAWEAITVENIGESWDIYQETMLDFSFKNEEMKNRHHREVVTLKKKLVNDYRKAKQLARNRTEKNDE